MIDAGPEWTRVEFKRTDGATIGALYHSLDEWGLFSFLFFEDAELAADEDPEECYYDFGGYLNDTGCMHLHTCEGTTGMHLCDANDALQMVGVLTRIWDLWAATWSPAEKVK